MRKSASVLGALALVVTMSPAAVASPDSKPQVVVDDTFEVNITWPFEFAPGEFDPGPCDFEGLNLSDVVTVRETEFYNPDGTFKKATAHYHGTAVWTGPDGKTVTGHYAWHATTETEARDVWVETGSFWNEHQPGSGVILHEKGRHILVDRPGGFTYEDISGPHEVYEDGFGALCSAVAPD